MKIIFNILIISSLCLQHSAEALTKPGSEVSRGGLSSFLTKLPPNSFSKKCYKSTLQGMYNFAVLGWFYYDAEGNLYPYGESANLYFDGNGKVQAVFSDSYSSPGYTYNVSGSYEVNDNCTGVINYISSVSSWTDNILISPDGESYSFTESASNYILSGTSKRIYRGLFK